MRATSARRCPSTRQVRWVLWLVGLAAGYLVLHAARPEVTGRPLSRLPVYVFQVWFFLVLTAERATKPSSPGSVPYAATLTAICLFVEASLVVDRQFIRLPGTSEGDSGWWPSDMLLEQFCYFGVLLPWAAGLAVGTLMSSLGRARC